jgi:hypothetical protein
MNRVRKNEIKEVTHMRADISAHPYGGPLLRAKLSPLKLLLARWDPLALRRSSHIPANASAFFPFPRWRSFKWLFLKNVAPAEVKLGGRHCFTRNILLARSAIAAPSASLFFDAVDIVFSKDFQQLEI